MRKGLPLGKLLLCIILLSPLLVLSQRFQHPGIPFTKADLDLLKANITREPWRTGYLALQNDARSKLNYSMRGPFATVSRVPNLNNDQWKSDMVAIHNLAFMWIFTGDTAYARKATDMLDAWAVTNTTWGGGENMLDIGDYAPYFVTGADILRGTYPGWTAANTEHVKNYFANVLYPASWVPGVLRDHNKGAIQLEIALGIAAFLDDPVRWNQAIEVYRMDAGGGLRNSLPNGEVGDAGRDDHWFAQIAALGWSAEVAWKQGVDMFAELDNRLLAIGELYNQYSIAPQTVTFIPFGGYSAYYTNWGIPPGFRHQHPFNNIIRAAYALRKGIPVPYTDSMRTLVGEGAWSFLYLKSADTSTATPLPPIQYPATGPVSYLTNIDIGNTGIAGTGSYDNGVWTVQGAGNALGNVVNFTGKPVKGDVSIIARVESNSLNTATTGLMIRESLAANASFVSINLYNNGTLNSRYNGGAGYTHYRPQTPWWLKIERVGHRVFTFHSQDGIHWTNNSLFLASLPADTYIGLYTISNNTSALNTATFTNVSVTNNARPGAPEINSAPAVNATAGAAFSHTVTATNSPTIFQAIGLPAGLNIDTLTGIISGTPTTPGTSNVLLKAGNAVDTGTAILVIKVNNNAAPAAPAGVTATVFNNTRITIAWPAVANASNYTVKRSLSPAGPFTTLQANLTGTSYTDAQPEPEVDNYYVVTALAGTLESGYSNVVSATVPPAVPAKPVVVNKNGQVDLSWPPAAGALTYRIKRGTVSGGPYMVIDTVSTNAFSDLNLTNGSAYYYVVSSAGNTKESANSPEAMGVPGATTVTWKSNAVTDSLNNAANWEENTLPVNPAILTFNASEDTVLTNDITGLELARIDFNAGANAYTISGNSLVLKHDLVNNAGSNQTLAIPLVLTGQLNVNTNTSSRITLSGPISGTGSLMKTGPGYLYITGSNTYSGNTIINGATGGWPPVNAIAIAGTGTGTPSAPTSGPLGTGRIILNGGSLYSENGDAVLYNDIEVVAGKRSYMYETVNAITLKGRLLGSGILEHDGNTYAGLHLQGDNSEFTGTFISKLRSGNQRVRFESPNAGSAKATWLLDANGVDCQGIQFPTGTLHFGALTGRGYIRNNAGGSPVISIGALNTSSRFDGTIVNFINIEKVGTGTLSFTGNHNYGGTTTVKKGKFLLVNNPVNGTFISPVIVEEGAFGGNGKSTAAVTIGTGTGPGARFEPGNEAIGNISIGTLTMRADATLAVELNPAANCDTVKTTGVVLNNAKLLLTAINNQPFPLGAAFMIVQNTGTAAVSGTFNGLPELAGVNINGYAFRITYLGGNGNDIVLMDERTLPTLITSARTDTTLMGKPYTYQITALNAPTAFSATGLPAGLSVDTATGIIAGTPTLNGTYTITIGASNDTATATATLTLVIQHTTVSDLLVAAGDGKNTIEWQPVYRLSYRIRRSATSSGPYTAIASTATSKYTDTTVTNGNTYYYTVAAADSTTEYAPGAAVIAQPNMGQHGYWAFNEPGNTRGIDAWGANHAVLAAAALRDTGYYGRSLKLDGSANAYATLPAGVVSTLNDFSIATWIRMEAVASWMRVFDFGSGTATYMFLTIQAGVAGGKSIVRYAIKNNNGAEQQVSFNQTIPLNTWMHVAITQAGNTCRLYINGTLVAANTNLTLKPAVLGNTTQNYLGKSQYNDPLFKGAIDEFKIYNRALTDAEVAGAMKATQLIVFDAIPAKKAGDAGFTIQAAASSGLPVTYSSTDVKVAIVDSTGHVHITGAGTTEITAIQAGNQVYNPATATQPFTVNAFQLLVQHFDGDHAQVNNNSSRPYLKILNNDSIPVGYKELTARYWFTPENYAGINTYIDYAQMGSKVKSKYVALDAPRQGAFGYVEYGFDSTAGMLAPGSNSGVIQSRLANANWASLAETDDYSYAANTTYASNSRITLYRNGVLVWGEEPSSATPVTSIKAYTLAVNSGSNTISTYLKLSNEGNGPLAYADLSIRYWFTSGDTTALNYWTDYAALGTSKISGTLASLHPALAGADHYLELKMDTTAGYLYPLSNTGNIQYRVAKANWSAFDQTDDHSYLPVSTFSLNEKLTVYYKEQLIWGTEPGAVLLTGDAQPGSSSTVMQEEGATVTGRIAVYPNPASHNLYIRVGRLEKQATLEITGLNGQLLRIQTITRPLQEISLQGLANGIYYIKVKNGTQISTQKIMKQ